MLKQTTAREVDLLVKELCDLKLEGMADALLNQYESPFNHDITHLELIELMICREQNKRDTRKIHNAIKRAGFKQNCRSESIIYDEKRGLSTSKMRMLLSCDFINKSHNILITGATGCGKSFIACAIGHDACRSDYRVKYLHLPSQLEQLELGIGNNDLFAKKHAELAKADLLILDDFGLVAMSSKQRHSLFNIIEDRYGIKSTIITSQLPVKSWHDYINDPTIADAFLDRVLHNAHRLELHGGSMRKTQPLAEPPEDIVEIDF